MSTIKELLNQEEAEIKSLEKVVNDNLSSDKILTSKLLEVENDDEATFGQRLSDKVADFGGSWTFILGFGAFIVVWIILNSFWMKNKGADPYPFILLNLMLSCLAALQAPIIMMSQNRQEEKDRRRARSDYMINLKSEIEIRNLHEKIDKFQQTHNDLVQKLLEEKKI